METLRNIQTAKQCLVWISFVFAQNGKHWSCRAQPALQCCPLHSLERDHTHLWSNSKVQNELKTHVFFAHFGTNILVNFPKFIILYQQNSVFAIFPWLVQIEAIPYPIASIFGLLFEKQKTVSRLDLVCLCPKTLVVLNLPCNAHCTV